MSFIADKIVFDGLTFDDVLLIPAYSEVLPREVDLTTKFSTLLFEIGALGYKFTLYRLIINIPGIIVMGYIIDLLVNKKPHKI